MNRRHTAPLFAAMVSATIASSRAAESPTTAPAIRVAHSILGKLAWQLTVPTGTFTDRTVFETIDLLHPLTIHHLELTPGQPLSADQPGAKVGHDMPAAQVAALLAKLKGVHMDVVSYGPVDLGADEATARAVFTFAKAISAKCVVAKAPVAAVDRLDALANEFRILVALPNGPTAYHAPADLLAVIPHGSKRVGSGDDLAGWRGDAVAATRLLRDHIVEVRVGDAQGTVDLPGVMMELRRQAFKGVIVVAPEPGAAAVERFVTSVNALSDAVTAAAK